jgi:TolB-like protein/DNA-binding winged helix-turn-helix (wHTH) protein
MAEQSKSFEFGPFRLEVRERRLTRDGYSVSLRGRVFDTLYALVKRHGCLVTKDELMAAVWPDSVVEETNLNHNICIIRRALGEKVTGQKYVETVPKQGYRFVAEVREVDSPEASGFPGFWEFRANRHDDLSFPEATRSTSGSQSGGALPNETRRQHPPPHTIWYRHQAIISSLAVAFLALAGFFGADQLGLFESPSNPRILLAVLPFENLTGESERKYVADGLNHEIISQLGRWNTARVGVIARTSSMVYQGVQKSVNEIGRELGVDYVVEGSVRCDEDRYRITVMLIRVKDQAQLWAASYDRTVDSVTSLQVEIASLVTYEIGRRIDVPPDESSQLGYPRSLSTQPPDLQHCDALSGLGSNLSRRVQLLVAS